MFKHYITYLHYLKQSIYDTQKHLQFICLLILLVNVELLYPLNNFLIKKNWSTGFVQLPRTFRKKLKDDNDNTNQVKRHNHVQSWPQLSQRLVYPVFEKCMNALFINFMFSEILASTRSSTINNNQQNCVGTGKGQD